MEALRARVRAGRLVLDEPTDLPEGQVVELVRLDELEASGDLEPDDKERLHESLRDSVRQLKTGDTLDARSALDAVRAKR